MKRIPLVLLTLVLTVALISCEKEVDKKSSKKADSAIFYVATDYDGSTANLMDSKISTYDAVWVGLYAEKGVKKYKLQAKSNETVRTEVGVINYNDLEFTLTPDNGNEGHIGSFSADKQALILVKENDERTEEIKFDLKDVNKPEHKGCK